jgi:hypothetical protein
MLILRGQVVRSVDQYIAGVIRTTSLSSNGPLGGLVPLSATKSFWQCAVNV